MSFTAADVKRLRELSGAGMMDCKKALDETGGNLDAAVDYLRKKGLSAAAKKSGRVAAGGMGLGVASGGTGVVLGGVSYTQLRAHETQRKLVCRLLLEKKKNRENTMTGSS